MLPATRHRAHRIRFENWRAHDDVDESLVVTRVGPRPSAPTCISPGHDSPTRPVGLRAVAPAGDDAPTYVGHGPEPEDNAITKQLPRIPRGYRPSLPAANQRTLPARRQRMAAADAERAPTLVAPRRKAKALRNRAALELPTQLLVLEHMKLAPTPAHVAEISRSVAFVATELEPEVGRRVLMRVAYGGTAGSAVGEVKTTLAGAGFTIRICASTAEFRTYADAVRSFLSGNLPRPPALDEPISVHLL